MNCTQNPEDRWIFIVLIPVFTIVILTYHYILEYLQPVNCRLSQFGC
jgi:hypothetical protein